MAELRSRQNEHSTRRARHIIHLSSETKETEENELPSTDRDDKTRHMQRKNRERQTLSYLVQQKNLISSNRHGGCCEGRTEEKSPAKPSTSPFVSDPRFRMGKF